QRGAEDARAALTRLDGCDVAIDDQHIADLVAADGGIDDPAALDEQTGHAGIVEMSIPHVFHAQPGRADAPVKQPSPGVLRAMGDRSLRELKISCRRRTSCSSWRTRSSR